MSSLAADTDVGGFRIRRLVGVGATGEIYQAIDERLGRPVALKLLKTSFVDEKTVQRFVDEARTTARFSHPHIVTVFAAGSFKGQPWIALEYLDGHSLRSRLDSGSVSPREAMRLMKAVCEGVAEAHRHHIVHADLKPENVIVPADGRLRVLDFGLSRLMGTDPTAASGTPAYMAPERWLGHAPTPAMDVWAIGVMLHELIEGSRPLDDRALAAYVYAPTEVALGAKAASQPCASLMSRCLSPDPTQRPSVHEVATQLATMLEGSAPGSDERAPFRGLDTFSEADAPDLQGREADVDAFVELLRRQPLVPLTGPSGIGKSSFLQAGVIPRLREQTRWLVLRCRPGARPLWSLANAIASVTPLFAKSPHPVTPSPHPVTLSPSKGVLAPADLETILTSLKERPGSLESFIAQLAKDHSSQVLLVIDQFEELFTLSSPEEATALVEALACLAAVSQSARVVLALRDDFLSAFAAMPGLRDFVSAIRVLPPLGRAALIEAVSAPLRRVRYFADSPDLATRIATELEGQPSALPLLQFACRALWERRDPERRLILTAEYQAMGGATGALAAHAQRFLTDAMPEERSLTRSLMLKLVNSASTRRPRSRSELLFGLEPRAEVVLDRLLAHRLLVSGRAAENEEALIELAHESLVTTWPALTRWLTETQEARKLSNEIEQAAALWVSRGRRDDETWSGPAVRQALERATEWRLVLSPVQHQFLEAGEHREHLRVTRRRRLLIAAFAFVTVLAIGSLSAAYAFRRQQLETLAQQKQITLAAADMGEFDLRLEPFDWIDGGARPAAIPPGLTWRLHAPDVDQPNQPGRLYGESDFVRHGARIIDGGIVEHLEVRSGPALLEIQNRGAQGEACGSSWLFLKHLPGYAERGVRGALLPVIFPTCEASGEGMIEIPAGLFMEASGGALDSPEVEKFLERYSIAKTEATRAEFAPYKNLTRLTGDVVLTPPPTLDIVQADDVPIVGLSAGIAERFCRYWGHRLPTYREWQKAYRGGLELKTGPNPNPRRVTLCSTPRCANLGETFEPSHITRVGQFPLDVSPYGLVDLEGNASEWTSTWATHRFEGLRVLAGSNWSIPEVERYHQSNLVNTRTPEQADFGTGVRCASDLD